MTNSTTCRRECLQDGASGPQVDRIGGPSGPGKAPHPVPTNFPCLSLSPTVHMAKSQQVVNDKSNFPGIKSIWLCDFHHSLDKAPAFAGSTQLVVECLPGLVADELADKDLCMMWGGLRKSGRLRTQFLGLLGLERVSCQLRGTRSHKPAFEQLLRKAPQSDRSIV